MQRQITLITLIILTLTTIGFAQQDKSKRPSPPAQAQCQFPDGKTIKTDYSSPRTHDPKTHQPRKIFGGLVPYGQVWRTGANDATTLVTDTNLTVGGKENRAWPIRAGATAWEAAGTIHTDIQKGFIRAEIISFADFVQAGGETQAKRAGKQRLELKTYVMQDYDVVNFRFNK